MGGYAQLIPDAFTPILRGSYLQECHDFSRRFLLAMPPALRLHAEIVQIAGEPLARFCLRDKQAARLRLRQAYLLAKARLRSNPCDGLQIAWALEIALWQQENQVRRRFSMSKLLDRFWTALPQASDAQLRQVLQLFDAVHLLYVVDVQRQIGWEGLSLPFHHGPVDHLDHRWPKYQERHQVYARVPLIQTLVGFLSRSGSVTGEVLAQLARNNGADLLADNAMPLQSTEWVWLAEYSRFQSFKGDEFFDQCWLNAYLRTENDAVRLNAIVVQLSRRFLLQIVPDRNRSMGVLLREVEAICRRTNTCREQGFRIMAACQAVLETFPPDKMAFLTADERNAIQRSGRPEWEQLDIAQAEKRIRPWFQDSEQKRAHAEHELCRELGPSLWKDLQIDTRAHLKEGYLAYHDVHSLSHGNHFNAAVLSFSLAIQTECAHWIWSELCHQPLLLGHLPRCKVRPPERHEWDLPSLAFYGFLLKRGSSEVRHWFDRPPRRFSNLRNFTDELIDLSKYERSRAVHDKRFARSNAENLYRRLFEGQFLRQLFLALQGKSC